MSLYTEIQLACTTDELAERNYHIIAAKVNAARQGSVETYSRMISERGVRAALGPIAGAKFMRVLKDLDAAAASDTVPAWLTAVLTAMQVPAQDHVMYLDTLGCGYDWVRSADGIDIGDPTTQSMLDLIAAGNPDLSSGIAALKALAQRPVAMVDWTQCQAAMEAGV